MCLPCGSSVSLTNAVSKHSVLRPCPCGSLLKGESREDGPQGCLPWEGPAFSLLLVAEKSLFPWCFACWGVWGKLQRRVGNVFPSSFLFKKIRFNLVHSWKTTIPPAVSKSSVLENTHSTLLPLASVDPFQAAITFSGKEYGAETFINGRGCQAPVVWHHLNIQIVNFMIFWQFFLLSQITYESHFPRNWPRNSDLLPQLLKDF